MQSPNRMALKSTRKSLEDENKILSDGSSLESNNNVEVMQNSLNFPSRSAVLQACTVTSGAIAALGILIRQVCSLFIQLLALVCMPTIVLQSYFMNCGILV